MNKKINNYTFNIAIVKSMKDFNEFYDTYKTSAYVHPVQADPNADAKALDPEKQKALLQHAWDVMRPSVSAPAPELEGQKEPTDEEKIEAKRAEASEKARLKKEEAEAKQK